MNLDVNLRNDCLLSAAVLQRQAAAATAAAAAARAEEEQKVVIRPARRPAVKPLRLRSPSSSDESEEEDSPSTRYRGALPAVQGPWSSCCPCCHACAHLSLPFSRDDVVNQQRLPTRALTSNKCSAQSSCQDHSETDRGGITLHSNWPIPKAYTLCKSSQLIFCGLCPPLLLLLTQA